MSKSFTTATVTALCGGALLLAGCGQAATPGVASAAAQRDISGSNCSGEDFEVTMRAQPHDGGSFLLELRNTSEKSCELGGWVHLDPRTSKDQHIDVPTDYVEIPAPPIGDQRLEPGETAYSGVRAEYGDPDFVAVGFRATQADVPGISQVTVEGAGEPYARLPLTHLQVGTLQPTSEGVLF